MPGRKTRDGKQTSPPQQAQIRRSGARFCRRRKNRSENGESAGALERGKRSKAGGREYRKVKWFFFSAKGGESDGNCKRVEERKVSLWMRPTTAMEVEVEQGACEGRSGKGSCSCKRT